MATTVEGAIKEALFARLATLVLAPVHPVAWPNLSFTPPAGNRYLEPKVVPNTVGRVFIGSNEPHQRLGFLQVNVRDALNQGTRIDDIAGAVAAHFPADLKLSNAFGGGIVVRITSDPSPGSALIETTPPGVVVPLLIPFECWA
ncbi:phage tail terminator-like protein [Devosia lacusdianchii]|uniref:phage tail terminator-like protein n=1 Tax=Devosia lacusdianchii TaxID=2917991 RepID=UPI001F065913|nr:phage tail terminator-like protein [Devosia sp. JXJ CY 41]